VESPAAYVQLLEMSAPEWVSGTARIDGDDVVLIPEVDSFYVSQREMERGRSLFAELFAVDDAYDVLGFARTWGLLWHGPNATEYREPVADWFRVVRELRAVLEIIHAQRESIASRDPTAIERLRAVLAQHVQIDRETWPEALPTDDERVAEIVVLDLLNCGLESTRLGVTSAAWIGYPMETGSGDTVEAWGQPGHFYSLTRFDTLVGYAFDTLRRHIMEQVELYACAHCGRINPRTHGNQVYCPSARPDARHPPTSSPRSRPSRCESAAKEQRKRERKAAAA
jgi:hypothetical protein